MKTREFISASGEPESEERVNTFEQIERSRKGERKSAELQSFLESIDFDVFSDALRSLTKGTRVPQNEQNIIKPQDIFEDLPRGFRKAYYDPYANRIYLYWDTIKYKAERRDEDPREEGFMILAHEEIHAISRSECKGVLEYEEGQTVSTTTQAGLSRVTIERGQSKRITAFEGFDEGVTEKLAYDVANLYSVSNPAFFSAGVEKFLEKYRIKNEPSGSAVNFVENFARCLADVSGLSEDEVWHAIVRSKIEGEALYSEDFKEFLGDTLPAEFSDKLAKATVNDIGDLLKYFRAKHRWWSKLVRRLSP